MGFSSHHHDEEEDAYFLHNSIAYAHGLSVSSSASLSILSDDCRQSGNQRWCVQRYIRERLSWTKFIIGPAVGGYSRKDEHDPWSWIVALVSRAFTPLPTVSQLYHLSLVHRELEWIKILTTPLPESNSNATADDASQNPLEARILLTERYLKGVQRFFFRTTLL